MKNTISFLVAIMMMIAIVFSIPITIAEGNDHLDLSDTEIVASQLQSRILSDSELALPTQELISLVLESPYMMEMMIFDSYTIGYESAALQFNGLQELESRDDSATFLLQVYLSEEVLSSEEAAQSTPNQFFRLNFLEILLSQNVYYSKLTEKEITLFENEVLQKYRERLAYSDTYSVTVTSAPNILSQAENAVQSTTLTYSTTETSTFSGYPVVALVANRALTSTEVLQITIHVNSYYPNVVRLAAPSSYYNCHSYAWHNQSASNKLWINGDQIDVYIDDPHSTRKMNSTYSVGDIVIYLKNGLEYVHSAVVTEISGDTVICTSKWGTWGLYKHKIDDVPPGYLYEYDDTLRLAAYYFTYSKLHIYTTSSYNASTHTRVCKVCDHTITESHTPNSAGTLCTGCSFTGPFSSIIQQLPEETELQTLLSKNPSLCCDDHAVH